PAMADPGVTELDLRIDPQPDEETCGPTALHAVYRYHGDPVTIEDVVREVTFLPSGGTLSVYLALHALARGYRTTIYTCNVKLFDPTWFDPDPGPEQGRGSDGAAQRQAVLPRRSVQEKLRQQHRIKGGGKLRRATEA